LDIAMASRRFDLWRSDDLSGWTHVDGFPRDGAGAPMEHAFAPGRRGYFKIEVTEKGGQAPEGMVLIHGGTFRMGDSFGEGGADELPVHDVYVSGFHMQSTEVTNDQMAAALQWAYEEGGRITVSSSSVRNVESGRELLNLDDSDCRITWNTTTERFELKAAKGAGYPCVEVPWYGAAAYCDYRSEMEGLTPCYDLSGWSCDFGANGYRLPTEAEWEKAARGGLIGKRFPWGDTISHSQANYRSDSRYSYDVSPTRGYHPDWDEGGYPYTSPVGTFAPNGYGLYDMSGNVYEWCWDWYDYSYYSSSPSTDPTGPSSGSYRVARCGSWRYGASYCRSAKRDKDYPDDRSDFVGFRILRSTN